MMNFARPIAQLPVVLALCALAGCSKGTPPGAQFATEDQSEAGPTSPHQPRTDKLTSGGQFLNWTVGASFVADDKLFVSAEDGIAHRLLAQLTIGDQLVTAAWFRTDEGKLYEIELEFKVNGKAEIAALSRWVDQACAPFTDRVQRHTPSPLGTPEPGVDWDPVTNSKGECSGTADGVSVLISENTASASDFARAEVLVVLSINP